MFSNIGNKIKGLAITLTVLGIITSIIYGIIVASTASELSGFAKNAGVIGGLLIIVVGSVLSWIGSLVLYGFGQLVESAQNIEKKITGSTDGYYSISYQKAQTDYSDTQNKDNGTVTAPDHESSNDQSNNNSAVQKVGTFVTMPNNDTNNRSGTRIVTRGDLLYCQTCGTVIAPGDHTCTGCKKRIDWTSLNG